MDTSGTAIAVDLTPYVPRLALEWELDAGEACWRALEGSLIFLDISGFTKMSERLARFGKLGAEEVTETLNSTFVRLLDVAYDHGGSLLKFGGDALLLWFSDHEHAQRAAATAFDLRAELRSLGRIQTTAGFVQLRMSVGVHTGTFHFFLVGSSHSELIVTGPGVTETVSMEHDASAGEILVSPALAAALDPGVLGAQKGPGRLLRRRPDAGAAGVAVRRPGTTEAAEFVSTALRSHISLGGQDAEHRQVAVAFVHFDGTDARIDAGDLDDVTADLDALVRVCQAVADDLGLGLIGSDVDADGGKLILVAGAPRSIDLQEEAILRGCRRIVGEGPTGLGVRIGVHRGHVFAGDVGTPYRRTYTVMGDAVNTAARVMSRAGPGELLATPDVFERSPAHFDLEALKPFAVKGKAKPLHASKVGPVRSERGPQAQLGLDLVGRQAELDELVSIIREAAAGTGRAVEIVAEAGLGKTRLVDEVRRQIDGVVWVTTTCEQYERTTPYFAVRSMLLLLLDASSAPGAPGADPPPLVDRLRALVRRVAPSLEPWLPLLAAPLDLQMEPTPDTAAIDPSSWRSRVNAAVKQLLVAVVGERAAVLVIDDAHWLDEASQSVLAALSLDIEDRPWALVLSRWPGPSPLDGLPIRTLDLAPLDVHASIELARAAAGGALLPQDADLVAERAGGSPLFVQELARSIAVGVEAGTLPETVEALIATRVDALAPRDRDLLQTAAVLGRRGDRRLLDLLVEDPSDLRRLVMLDDFLAIDEESFAFRHGLVRDVAYERLPFRRRRQLHLRIARVAEGSYSGGEEAAELLSLHFHHGGDADRSWRHSSVAAERAEQKFAYVEATTFWSRALDAGRRVARPANEIGAAWRSHGDACMRCGRLDDARRSYASARKHLVDAESQGRLCLLEGLARQALGDGSAAIRWYRRGLRVLVGVEGGDAGAHRTRLRLACADVEYRRGRYASSMREAHKALAEAEELGDERGIGHSCNTLLLVGTALADPAAEAYGRRAIEAFERVDLTLKRAEVLNNLAEVARRAGKWDEATKLFTQARQALRDGGDVLPTAVVTHNLAEVLSDQGHLEAARALMEEALATFRGARSQFVPYTQTLLGRLASRLGDHATARELLDAAAQGMRRVGDPDELAKAMAYEAERLLFEGSFEDAAALTDQLLHDAPALIRPLIHRVKGCALASLGDFGEGRVSLLEGLRLARSVHDEFETALLTGALAWSAEAMGQPAEAVAYADEAQRVLRLLGVVAPRTGIPIPVHD